MNNQNLADILLKELRLNNRTIQNRLVLAPMAGLGHISLRKLIAEYGGFGLLFTGMCSAKAIPSENPNTSLVFNWRKEELDYLVCQIFGSNPADMAKAAERIEREGFFGVDLNFGCSVAVICKKGCGAALLKNPTLSSDIVRTVRKSVSIPLFVKFRTGWENKPELAVEMAKRFQDAGADALTFHPRIAPDRRTRPPQWDVIKLVQDAVSIPVFGNGNLFNATDGLKMTNQTNCQGLSVGRMAVAKPWLFAEWTKGFIPNSSTYLSSAIRLTQILTEHYTPEYSVKLFKKFTPFFCANFKFGHAYLKRILHANTIEELQDTLETIFVTPPETVIRPNLNLFL